jgi:hypothetical protein
MTDDDKLALQRTSRSLPLLLGPHCVFSLFDEMSFVSLLEASTRLHGSTERTRVELCLPQGESQCPAISRHTSAQMMMKLQPRVPRVTPKGTARKVRVFVFRWLSSDALFLRRQRDTQHAFANQMLLGAFIEKITPGRLWMVNTLGLKWLAVTLVFPAVSGQN